MNYTIAAEIEFIHREHVFGIIVGNSKVCSELAFFGFIRCQHIADLNISPFAVFIANKINFAVTDLSNTHLVSSAKHFKTNDVFKNQLNIAHIVAV